MESDVTIWVVGSLNADLVQHVDRIPCPGETVSGADLETYPGGKGANQACAESRLGGKVRMIGNVVCCALSSAIAGCLNEPNPL